MEYEEVVHPFAPVYDSESKVLILGSFPSIVSRKNAFYYGNPANRFWKVMEVLFEQEIKDKKQFCLNHHIALWDVIGACSIQGSSDTSIRDVEPNDLSRILDSADIKQIFVNGKKAEAVYRKYTEKKIGIKAICLPSTSPANAAWTLDKLIEAWRRVCP